jgi:RNA polymerase sigma-70 factor (ECF subfamily)
MEIGEFNSFFELHYAAICARVNLLVQQSDLSEDLVQDAFVKFWETKPTLLNKNAAPGYVARIAINNALMHLRSKRQHEKKLKEFGTRQSIANNPTEEAILYQESEKRLINALKRLPPACREIFILSRYEQMSYKEIASHLNLSIKTVENQLLKALHIMREHLLLLIAYLLS